MDFVTAVPSRIVNNKLSTVTLPETS